MAVSLSAVKSITEMANLCSGQFPQVCTFYINNLAGLGSQMPIDGSIGIKWTPKVWKEQLAFPSGKSIESKISSGSSSGPKRVFFSHTNGIFIREIRRDYLELGIDKNLFFSPNYLRS